MFLSIPVTQKMANFVYTLVTNKRHIKCSVWKVAVSLYHGGFSGLEVGCWPLVPKFVGSHPAEAIEFLEQKKKTPQHIFHRRGTKTIDHMS